MGRQFPARPRCRRGPARATPDRLVGGIYAANTVGAIVGALTFSLILVPAIGTSHSQSLLIVMAAVSGLCVLAPAACGLFALDAPPPGRGRLVVAV